MDDKEFEKMMKELGEQIMAEGRTYILNPNSVLKATKIVKKLNEIKEADEENDYKAKIGFNINTPLETSATIIFNFEFYGLFKEEYESVFEIMNLSDEIMFNAGYSPDTVTISFTIHDYLIEVNSN